MELKIKFSKYFHNMVLDRVGSDGYKIYVLVMLKALYFQ